MELIDFIKVLAPYTVKNNLVEENFNLKKVTADSREADSETIFFCIKGKKSDGHDFIDSAIKQGCRVIVGENQNSSKNYIQVNSVKESLKVVTPIFYGYPDTKMKMVGVTGTNGKTSTAFIIENMVKEKLNCGVIGTLCYKFSGRKIEAQNTTPQNWKWYTLLDEMQKSGVEVVVSEVSSHALAENRIEKTLFDVAIFTNLTRDHLDFHKSIENYYQAKKKLFTQHLKVGATAIINTDDGYGKRLSIELPEKIRQIKISALDKNAELFVDIKEVTNLGSRVVFHFNGFAEPLKIPLVGKFNIYNSASAFAAVQILLGVQEAFKEVKKSLYVPGRLERIGESAIYVDYAHTPDALENVLKTLHDLKIYRQVITVFGAGGDRDQGKRALMGEVASRLSDIVILTNDNPRTENPQKILNDILAGCNSKKCLIEVVAERAGAIRRAISLKRSDGVVVIAGKGAEEYQITKEGKRFFSDKDEVEKYLKELQDVHHAVN